MVFAHQYIVLPLIWATLQNEAMYALCNLVLTVQGLIH